MQASRPSPLFASPRSRQQTQQQLREQASLTCGLPYAVDAAVLGSIHVRNQYQHPHHAQPHHHEHNYCSIHAQTVPPLQHIEASPHCSMADLLERPRSLPPPHQASLPLDLERARSYLYPKFVASHRLAHVLQRWACPDATAVAKSSMWALHGGVGVVAAAWEAALYGPW